MPRYAYRAVHSSGRLTRGILSAANENELAHYLAETGMELITAREKKERQASLPFKRRLPLRALSAFCTRMRDLLVTGLPFVDCLRDATETIEHPVLRDALLHVGRAMANGGGIALSFALYPRFFSPVFIAILSAGEKSGDMAVIFGHLSRYAVGQAQTQERVRRALRYPLFLFIVAGSAVSFMLATVVPQIAQFLSSLQGELPFSTRALITLSRLFSGYGEGAALGFLMLAAMVFMTRATLPAFAIAIDGFLLQLPLLGAVISKTGLARFTHSFSLLFRSGSDVPDCLRQSRDILTNRAMREDILQAEERVQSGCSLSRALEGVWPPFAVGLLRTGERSGDLGRALDEIALAYDREAQAATDSFIGALEPALTLAIGGLLIWTVLAVLGPLYSSLSILGGRM